MLTAAASSHGVKDVERAQRHLHVVASRRAAQLERERTDLEPNDLELAPGLAGGHERVALAHAHGETLDAEADNAQHCFLAAVARPAFALRLPGGVAPHLAAPGDGALPLAVARRDSRPPVALGAPPLRLLRGEDLLGGERLLVHRRRVLGALRRDRGRELQQLGVLPGAKFHRDRGDTPSHAQRRRPRRVGNDARAGFKLDGERADEVLARRCVSLAPPLASRRCRASAAPAGRAAARARGRRGR